VSGAVSSVLSAIHTGWAYFSFASHLFLNPGFFFLFESCTWSYEHKTFQLKIFYFFLKFTIEKEKKMWCLILVSFYLAPVLNGFNLEPRIPVIKNGLPGSYFGYSVAQHQSINEGSGSTLNWSVLIIMQHVVGERESLTNRVARGCSTV